MAAPVSSALGISLMSFSSKSFTSLRSIAHLHKVRGYLNFRQLRNASSWRSRLLGGSKEDSSDSEEVEHRQLIKHDGPTTSFALHSLKKRSGLNTVRGYRPPPNVTERVQSVAEGIVGTSVTADFALDDRQIKFKLLTTLMKEFDHTVPNTVLTDLQTIDDIIAYFSTPVKDQNAFEDLASLDLPKNLHIQMEPVRFDPETDTFFDGKTAFAGRPTIVSSLRYRRKFKGNTGESRNAKSKTNYELEKELEEDRQKIKKKHFLSEGIIKERNYKRVSESEVPIIKR